MPPLTSYTEPELAAFIVTTLSNVAVILGWTVTTPQVLEAVSDTLLADGLTDIADADSIQRLRARAKVEAWKAAAAAVAAFYDHKADGGEFDREKLHGHALLQLKLAQADLAEVIADELPLEPSTGRVSNHAVLRGGW